MTRNSIPVNPSTQRGRVLLVDDDPQVSALFRAVLERRGHTVVQAANGHDGLEVAARESPEIMLLDLNMPLMGGLEVLEKCTERFPDLPVIIISGTGDMNDAIAALRRGAWDYLTKPVMEASVLTHTVEMNLERARLIRQNRLVHQELELLLERMRSEEEAGRRIQARLFPPAEWQFGPYRFEHRVVPSLVLSGDMPNYFAVDDRFAVLYCADVAGHGVSSALVTVLVKSLIDKYREHYASLADRLLLEPDRLLQQLNKELLQEGLGKHLTLFYGVLDQQTNTLSYASGGQYPPPMLFADGSLQLLEQKSMAVGLFPFARFHTETVSLPGTFRLVLASDGALDALPSLNTEDRLAHLHSLRTRADLAAFVEMASAQRELPDDLTVLSVTKEQSL